LLRGNRHLPTEAAISAWRAYHQARRQWAAEHGLTAREFIDLIRRERESRTA